MRVHAARGTADAVVVGGSGWVLVCATHMVGWLLSVVGSGGRCALHMWWLGGGECALHICGLPARSVYGAVTGVRYTVKERAGGEGGRVEPSGEKEESNCWWWGRRQPVSREKPPRQRPQKEAVASATGTGYQGGLGGTASAVVMGNGAVRRW